MLVRTSTEKVTGIPSHRRSFTLSRDTLDEKIALNRSPETLTVAYADETLLYADDEEEAMTSTYLSEKHLEAGADYANDECTTVGRHEDTVIQDVRWHRRGVLFKPKSKPSKGGKYMLYIFILELADVLTLSCLR